MWFCPRVTVHKSLYKGANNTQQLANDSKTKKEQWLFPCEPAHQDRTDYIDYTRRHLFQRIEEHKHSAIGKNLHDARSQRNKDLQEQFTILKKCRAKFECLNYEMLFIQEDKPVLNNQSDSIKAKLFST